LHGNYIMMTFETWKQRSGRKSIKNHESIN
jgi:hypothetical protein